MAEQTTNLTDDVVLVINGDKFPATVGPNLRAQGWQGGIWVKYIPPPNMVDEYVVEASDGNSTTGFLAFPSEDYDPGSFSGPVNNYTGVQLRTEQGSRAGASTVTITAGGGRFLFRIFETVAIGPGGLRDGTGGFITYNLNEDLVVSENGFLCNDPDVRLAMVGIATVMIVGKCCAVPHVRNGNRLGLDLKF